MCLDNFEEWSASVEARKVAAERKFYIDPARVTPTVGPYWVTGIVDDYRQAEPDTF